MNRRIYAKIFILLAGFIAFFCIIITSCPWYTPCHTFLDDKVFGDFRYREQNGTITIVRYSGEGGMVIIPEEIDGMPVTSIGDFAFHANELTGVVIPNSVISIGDVAFTNNKLTDVIIPDSVTSIGILAFGSNLLTNVVIPNGITGIGTWAFA